MSPYAEYRLVMLSASLLATVLFCWSEEGQGKKPRPEIKNSIGMKLAMIPPGKFTMGSPKEEKGRNKDEEQRVIEIEKAFYLGIHEVTQEQFEKLMGFNPSYFSTRATGKQRSFDLRGIPSGEISPKPSPAVTDDGRKHNSPPSWP